MVEVAQMCPAVVSLWNESGYRLIDIDRVRSKNMYTICTVYVMYIVQCVDTVGRQVHSTMYEVR
jgi:hypothetical protein